MAVLLLDPAHPVLWRDARALQVGHAPPVCVIDDPAPWQLALLDALARGIPRGAIAGFVRAHDGDPGAAADLVEALAPALRASVMPREIGLAAADVVPHEAVLGLVDALQAAGARVERVSPASAAERPDRLVVLAGAGVVPPHLAHELMAADVPHLPLALETRRARVGPIVRPGATPCLSCIWAHEADLDPAWPALASQLATAPSAPSRALAALAGSVVPRLLRRAEDAPGTSRSLEVSADGRGRWRSHRPHAGCLCRSPRGSETAGARIVPHPATRTGTASARHA